MQLVRENCALRPSGLIERLNLKRPSYRATAAYGHFGRTEAEFTWERTDKVPALAAKSSMALTELLINKLVYQYLAEKIARAFGL